MDITEFTKDGIDFKNFCCPHCGVFSQMRTSHVIVNKDVSREGWSINAEHQLYIATCQCCGNSSLENKTTKHSIGCHQFMIVKSEKDNK